MRLWELRETLSEVPDQQLPLTPSEGVALILIQAGRRAVLCRSWRRTTLRTIANASRITSRTWPAV